MEQLEELRPIRYAQVPNEACDTLPDLNSVGLLTIMLRHAPGFPFTVGKVIAQKRGIPGPRLGKDVAYGAMTTLIKHRWAARVKWMCAGGHIHTSTFRTSMRFTDDDLRAIATRFTEGTEKIVHCSGCTDDPEIPVRTVIRAGATLEGPWGKHERITDLLAPGGRLNPSPVPGKPETGDAPAFPQVGPVPGKPETGEPETGEPEAGFPETFKKTKEEHSSSSASVVTGVHSTPEDEEEEETWDRPSAPTAPTGRESDSGSGSGLRMGQSDPALGEVGSEEPPSSGGEATSRPSQEDQEAARRPARRRVADVVMDRTDATAEEARAVVERIRRHAQAQGQRIGSLSHYVSAFAVEDLEEYLDAIRREAAPQPRVEAPAVRRSRCTRHGGEIPCGPCRADLNAGGIAADAVITLYERLGAEAAFLRPDLAGHPVIAAMAGGAAGAA